MPITSQARLAKTKNKNAIRRELAELKGEVKKLKAATTKRKEAMEYHRRSVLEHEVAVHSTEISSVLSKDRVADSIEAIRNRSISFDQAVVKAKSTGGGRKQSGGGILSDVSSGSTIGLRVGPRRSQRRRSVLKKPGYKSRKKAHNKKVTLLAAPSTASSTSAESATKSDVLKTGADRIPKSAFQKKASIFSQTRALVDKGARRATIAKIFGQNSAAADKVRGRVARRIRILGILRFLGHTYTMITYEFLICTLLVAYFHAAGYASTVDPGNVSIDKFLRGCDIIFICDLIYRLLVQLLRHFAQMDYSILLIPCTPGFWFLHLACLFPAEHILNSVAVAEDMLGLLAHSTVFRYNRFGLLYRLWSFVDILEVEQYVSERAAFLIIFYLIYITFISSVAAVLISYPVLLSGFPWEHFMHRAGNIIEGTWIEKAYITNPGIIPKPFSNYLLSMSFSTSMVTTVGYGDPAPNNELEMVFGILAMLIGSIAIAGWFGSKFTGFLLAKDRARYELFHRAEVIQQHLKTLGSTALFCEKTREFYECLWNYREGVYKVEMIKLLPTSMHEDIIFDVCSEMFHKTLMFRGLDEPFLRAVSHTVEVVIYNPEMILCLQGERPNCMYYIIQGECVAKTRHSSNQTSVILRPGCVFGETSLFASYPHTVNIETRTCCQLLVIHKDRLNAVCKQYPDSWAVMRARMRARLSKLREHFDVRGTYPIIWTTRKHTHEGHHHSTAAQLFPEYPLTIRWADGFSRKVPPDAIETTQLPVIVEMGCLNPEYASEEINTYGTCVIPITLTIPGVHIWHVGLLLIGVPYYLAVCFTASADLAMIQGPTADLLANVPSFDQVVALIYLMDVFIEIFTATPSSEYNPFDDSDYTGSDSSGTESLQEYSISSTVSAVPLLPVDDPMDGTTTYSRCEEDAGSGVSLQNWKAVESSSSGEGFSGGSLTCDNMSAKAEKEAEDKDRNDKASAALFHEATEKSTELAECERSGRDSGPPKNQSGLCTSMSISDVDGRAQKIMKMHATNASKRLKIGETSWVATGGSTALAYVPPVYGQKEEMNEESETGLYNFNMDCCASSCSGPPHTFQTRKPSVSIADSARSQRLETWKMLEKNPVGTSGEHNFPSVEGNVVENPEKHMKFNDESNEKSAVKESSRAVPSCGTVKATVEKATGSERNSVSRFQAKLSETKKKEFLAATKKVNLVNSVSALNVQASSRFPKSLGYSTRHPESNIEKNILQPGKGAFNVSVAPTLLSEYQVLPRSLHPPVVQVSYLRRENSEKKLKTNVLDEAQAHGEATVETKIGPGHASKIFDMGVKQRLKSLKLQKICEDNVKVFIEYCSGWFEAKSNLPIEQVPQESLDNADRAFKIIKAYVDSVEAVFHQYNCLPLDQFSQYVLPLSHGISKDAPPVFREVIANRIEEFANEYEKRNAEIVRQEEEVIKVLIGTAGDYFEEEAAFFMKSDYFEAQPLSILLSPIEEQTKQSFLHACDIKFPMSQRKYSEMLDAEVKRRKNKIQSESERQRLKTQKEIDETVDRFVFEYTQGIEEKLKNLRSLWYSQQEKFQQAHLTVKEKIIQKIDAEFLKKCVSCPGLHDVAIKNLETKIEEVRNREYESLVAQKGTALYNSTATSYSTYSEKVSYHVDHNQRGRTTAKGAPRSLALAELPSHTVAIHMGLSRTRLGVFRPGTKEFLNIAEVDNCLYSREDSILLAYNDSDKQKLKPHDVNFEGSLVDGPIDELREVTLKGERLRVRKEHIISSILAVLKCKAELELQAKFRHCVVVVPQFLNDAQRTCIRDAACIADFNDINIIDDTVAIALEYMMTKQEQEGYFIVTCATEGVVDVAKFHFKEGILRRLEVSGTHFLRSEQAKKPGWGLRNFFSGFTWSREVNVLKKIFTNNELNLGQHRLEQTLKLFVGDTEMLNSIKTVLKEATNFQQVSELNAIKGGAMFAALCEERPNGPMYSSWKSMRSWAWGNRFDHLKTKILSVYEKERKRSSNPSEGMAMTVEALKIEKRESHLRCLKELHGIAIEAVKIIRSVQIAVSQNKVQDPSSSELLLQQLAKHKLTLQQPNLRLEEAKKTHDELLNIWYESPGTAKHLM